MVVIGNIFGLIGAILMVYSGYIKRKKKIIYVQSIQIFLLIISNIFLKGISGIIINILSFIRNILCYKNRLGFKEKILLTVFGVVFTFIFNNSGIIGILPLISMILYLWFMTINNIIKFKFLIIVTSILWAIYDFTIKSYFVFLFDVLTILTNIISIFEINKHKSLTSIGK